MNATRTAALGRNGDRFLAHVAHGETIVPPVISPQLRAQLYKEMRAAGIPPEKYVVGAGMSINPMTGHPEFGFGKFLKKAFKKVLPIAATVAGGYFGGPIGASIGSGVGTKLSGGSLSDALKSAAFSYAGGKLGGILGESSFGKSIGLGGSIGDAVGLSPANISTTGSGFMLPGGGAIDALGGSGNALGSLGSYVANSSLGGALGSYAGNSLAAPEQAQTSGPAPFSPKQEAQQELPSGLAAFGALSPEQQSTNLATQGVYGGGIGPQEQSYFTNLLNRRLVDESGRADQDLSEINPIESSYLAQLGLGGYSNSRDLLEAMSKWRTR